VRGVEAEALRREFGKAEGLGGDGGEDGVPLCEEGIEGAAEAVVVEALGGDVPEEVGAGGLGPGGDVNQGGGLAEAGGQEEADIVEDGTDLSFS
jgi:hypothetical protein